MMLWLNERATLTELDNMTLEELDTATRYLDAYTIATAPPKAGK
jgi:hypothetical protein